MFFGKKHLIFSIFECKIIVFAIPQFQIGTYEKKKVHLKKKDNHIGSQLTQMGICNIINITIKIQN